MAAILGLSNACCTRYHESQSTQSENSTGRPTRDSSGQLGADTPHLLGPDPVELAPLVALNAVGIGFDHEPVDQATLEKRLRTYRVNFPLLHPSEPPPTKILFACSPAVSADRLFAVLETAYTLGFDRAGLVFEAPTPGAQITAARVSIGPDPGIEEGERRVRASDSTNCSQLSEHVVALRRAGVRVLLVTGGTK